MTKKEYRTKLNAMITESAKAMRRNIEKIILSGSVDLESEPEGTYSLVKDSLVALLEEEAWQYGPNYCSDAVKRQAKKNTRNIRRCI